MSRVFDGDDVLTVDDAPVTAVPYTISVWAKIELVNVEQAFVWIGDKDQPARSYVELLCWHTTPFRTGGEVVEDDGSLGNYGTATAVVDTWYHLVLRARNVGIDVYNVYRNGVVGTGTGQPIASPTGMDRLTLGRQGGTSALYPLTGKLSNLAIWNTDIGTTNISLLAAGTSPLIVSRSSLIRYWPLNGAGATKEVDLIAGSELTCNGTTQSSDEPAGLTGSLMSYRKRLAMIQR